MGSLVVAALSSLRNYLGGTRGKKPEGGSALGTRSGRLFAGLLFLLLGFTFGCGGGSSSSSGPLSVSVSPGSAVVALGGTQAFQATVSNDPSNKGVTWTLSQYGLACSPACGTISPASSASGASVTYTAPGTALTVTLTATSVSNTTVAFSVSITTTGSTAVSVSPTSATVALSGTQQFAATVANDSSNKGVNWTLAQSGNSCSPGCGTVSPTSTANGVATTYTAPATAPTSNSPVTLTANSVAFPGQTAWATITIEGGVKVSVAPSYVGNVPENGTQQFVATVTNDTSNQGVTWALTQNGKACSPTCGSISPTSTASGAATTYTAPSSATTATLTATSVADTSISSYATIVVEPISIAITPTSAILYPGNTQVFAANVSNDIANGGVKWTLTENGGACSSSCGSLSSTSTASGVANTYTAPSTISSAATITLTATSVTDNTKSATATVSLYPPITVSVSPGTATVAVNDRTTFTATVANDPTNAGVQWTLTQSGKSCSPDCGNVSPKTTLSGVATTYFAPGSVPSPSAVTLTAQSAADISVSDSATVTVSSSPVAARFSGSYAFSFNGYDSGGAVAIVGSFTADGAGKITGVEDANRASGVTAAQPFTGSYTIASDGSGSFTLTGAPQGTPLGTFRFALDASAKQAQFVELGDSGARGTGVLVRQTIDAFSPAVLHGDYAFGASGAGVQGERLALAGRFQADGADKITAGVLDWNDGGNVAAAVPFTGSYTLSPSGRGTLVAATAEGTLHWAFYVASPGRVFLISTDPRYASPLSSGTAIAQASGQAGAFSTASLSGTSVIRLAGAAAPGTSNVAAGLVTFDGRGGLAYTMDENDAGNVRAVSGKGIYTVAPNGRVSITLDRSATPLVSYLLARNQALLVGTGQDVSSGRFDPQSPGPFTNTSLSGSYILRTLAAPAAASALQWGRVTSAGLGTLDGSAGGLSPRGIRQPAARFSETYAVSRSGRAALDGGSVVLYFLSPSRAVAVDMTPGTAAPTLSELIQ